MLETTLPVVIFVLVAVGEPVKTIRYYDNYSECRADEQDSNKTAYCGVLTIRNANQWNPWNNDEKNSNDN